jgi:glutathione S-transferase
MTTTTHKLVLCDFPSAPPPRDARWLSYSPFVTKVDRALKLAKLPFTHERVEMMRISKLNPKGQLPVLLVNDEVVSDSTTILQRIDQLAPGSLNPGLEGARLAEAWLWEEFADTALYPQVLATRWADDRGWPVVRQAFFGSFPPVVRDLLAGFIRRKTFSVLVARDFTRGGLAECETRLFRVLDQLEARAPKSGFWLGEAPSVADLGLFAQLHSLRLPETAFRASDIAARKNLSAWLDRVDAATSGTAASTGAQASHPSTVGA